MENKSVDIHSIVNNLSLFKKLYDVIRVVDPTKKELLDIKENKLCNLKASCYKFWEQNKVCNNCVSARAYNENDTFIKIEYNGQKVYMLTAIPIQLQNKKIVLELLKDVTESGLIENIDKKDTNTIRSIVSHMNDLIVKDPLTNTFNKRFIQERLPVDALNSFLNKEPFSMIMMDIDFFKKVNDTYGHVAGDEVLKNIANIINKFIRKDVDWVGRYGGEEFLIYLKNTNKNSALTVGERIRKNIENSFLNIDEHIIKVTASFGIETILDDKLDIESIIKKVDSKLYEAKNTGRNKIIC